MPTPLRNKHTAEVDGVPAGAIVNVTDPQKAERMIRSGFFAPPGEEPAPVGIASSGEEDADKESRRAAAARMLGSFSERPAPTADDMARAVAEIDRLRGLVREQNEVEEHLRDKLASAEAAHAKHTAESEQLLNEASTTISTLQAKVDELSAKQG